MTAFVHGTLRCIQDSKGADYLAVVLHGNCTQLHAGWAHLQKLGLGDAIAARHARDGIENAHVTIMNVAEWGGVAKYQPDVFVRAQSAVGRAVAMRMHGLGKATSKNTLNTAWYGIVSCDAMADFRSKLGMRLKDFHVTQAFTPKDVFDANKGMGTLFVTLDQMLNPTSPAGHMDYSSGPSPC